MKGLIELGTKNAVERMEEMKEACQNLSKAVVLVAETPYVSYLGARKIVDGIIEERKNIEKLITITITEEKIKKIKLILETTNDEEIVKSSERKIRHLEKKIRVLTTH
jgi:hypothetical protein